MLDILKVKNPWFCGSKWLNEIIFNIIDLEFNTIKYILRLLQIIQLL